MQTNSDGLSFCSSRKYGSNWSSVTPPSAPSCTSDTSAPLAGIASLPRGRHRLHEDGFTCLHYARWARVCLYTRAQALASSSAQKGLVQLSALGLLGHVWRRLQNQSVGLICMAYACNALNSNTCYHRSSHCLKLLWLFRALLIIYCKLHHN